VQALGAEMVRLRSCLTVRPDTGVTVGAPTIYFLGGLLDALCFRAGLFPGVVLLSRRR
jgi:hypothetical protein